MIAETNSIDTPEPTTKRFVGIDVMRYLVLFPIVGAHTIADYRFNVDVYGIIENCGRFVVPFFFIASGYFLGRKDPPVIKGIIGLLIRLLPPFLFWLLVYLVAIGQIGNLRDPFFLFQCLYYGGPAYHLWFLPALGMSAALVLISKPLSWSARFSLAGIIYGLGLATSAYRDLLGFPRVLNTEVGPFFGFLFVLIGYYMAKENVLPPMKKGIILWAAGTIVQLGEAYAIMVLGHSYFSPHIFLAGTVLQGIGAFTVSLHIRKFPGSDTLTKLGKASLGMYCSHMLFVVFFERYFDQKEVWQAFVIVTLSMLGATILSYSMSKVKYMDRLVR